MERLDCGRLLHGCNRLRRYRRHEGGGGCRRRGSRRLVNRFGGLAPRKPVAPHDTGHDGVGRSILVDGPFDHRLVGRGCSATRVGSSGHRRDQGGLSTLGLRDPAARTRRGSPDGPRGPPCPHRRWCRSRGECPGTARPLHRSVRGADPCAPPPNGRPPSLSRAQRSGWGCGDGPWPYGPRPRRASPGHRRRHLPRHRTRRARRRDQSPHPPGWGERGRAGRTRQQLPTCCR